jgi:hypothetical protein
MTDKTQSIHRDDQVHMLAAAAWRDGTGVTELMPSVDVTARYATELLRDSGDPGADRFLDATRVARLLAADETAWPGYWRQAMGAVALCRRAAEIAARR